MTLTQDAGETIAIKALGWLAGNEELLPVFLGSSGASEADLRSRMNDADFLISILDFLTMDDAWVISFCDEESIAYDMIMQARQSLPGGAEIHWT